MSILPGHSIHPNPTQSLKASFVGTTELNVSPPHFDSRPFHKKREDVQRSEAVDLIKFSRASDAGSARSEEAGRGAGDEVLRPWSAAGAAAASGTTTPPSATANSCLPLPPTSHALNVGVDSSASRLALYAPSALFSRQ